MADSLKDDTKWLLKWLAIFYFDDRLITGGVAMHTPEYLPRLLRCARWPFLFVCGSALAACAIAPDLPKAARLPGDFYKAYPGEYDIIALTPQAGAYVWRNLTVPQAVSDEILASGFDLSLLKDADPLDRLARIQKAAPQIQIYLGTYSPSADYYVDLPFTLGPYEYESGRFPLRIIGLSPGTNVSAACGPECHFSLGYDFINGGSPDYRFLPVPEAQAQSMADSVQPIYRDSPAIARVYVHIETRKPDIESHWYGSTGWGLQRGFTMTTDTPTLKLRVTHVALFGHDRQLIRDLGPEAPLLE